MFNFYQLLAMGAVTSYQNHKIRDIHKQLLSALKEVEKHKKSRSYSSLLIEEIGEKKAEKYFRDINALMETLNNLKVNPGTKSNLRKLKLISEKSTSIKYISIKMKNKINYQKGMKLLVLKDTNKLIFKLVVLYEEQIKIEEEKWKKNLAAIWIMGISLAAIIIFAIVYFGTNVFPKESNDY